MKSVKYVMKDTVHFLSSVTDENTIAFTLKSSEKFIPFIASIPKIAKVFLRVSTSLWNS